MRQVLPMKLLLAVMLAACVTVNVYFPAAAAQTAADQIIDRSDGWRTARRDSARLDSEQAPGLDPAAAERTGRHRRDVHQRGADPRRRLPPPGVPRSELHVTTKVWHENLAPDAIRRAFDASLTKLRARPCRSLSRALAIEGCKLGRRVRDLDEAEAGGAHAGDWRRQLQHRAAQDRGRGHQGADRLQPGRISRDARSIEGAGLSRRQVDLAGRLLPAGAGRVASDPVLARSAPGTMRPRRKWR